MIRRALLTTVIVIGTAAYAPSAFAQTVNIPFTGNVPGACTFGTLTAGKLGLNTPTNPTSLAGGYPGGAFGQVSVTCNSPAKVVVSNPVQTGGPSFTPMNSIANVNSPVGSTSSNGGVGLSLPTGNSIPLSVDMKVDKSSPLTPGNYNYNVTLTITP